MSTLDGARWEDVGNKEDFLYVYGGGTDWDAAKAGWEQEHNQALMASGGSSTTSFGGSPTTSSGGSSGGSPGVSYTNPQNNLLALQAANYAAQLEFQEMRFKKLELPEFQWMKEKEKEELALKAAADEWARTYQTSLLTGKFKGQDTAAWAAQQAELTGYFKGAPTLAREEQEATNAYRAATLLASLRGPTNAFQMAKVIQNGGLSGVLAAASGKYGLPSFGGTDVAPQPVTMQQFLGDAVSGRTGLEEGGSPYIPNQQPAPFVGPADVTPRIIDNPVNQSASGAFIGPSSVNYSPPATPAPSNQYNYQGSPDGSVYVYPPGTQAPQAASQVSSPTPTDPSQLNAITGGGVYGYSANPGNPTPGVTGPVQPKDTRTSSAAMDITTPYMPGSFVGPAQSTSAVPAPNPSGFIGPASASTDAYTRPGQINAENYANMNPYNKDLLWAYYESKGWDPAAAKAEFEASLPKYGGPQFGRVAGVV